ncbi:hypothetical protein I302_108096 [Kwoniella bestiolae CBS 10118]|uniref:Uncharacterized protein n=1 Tax=Kwoniella bestiolae CBS 10118 TaxID=1296100 RepID=A0A1B9FWN5_9TREE|nr:hypothetical protein I302_07538 [Kwoniella bestiolae CBS 10118]OCF23184.1 hypothetical protein I302_07538 [Kwoniella bestiolae CBS 10118]
MSDADDDFYKGDPDEAFMALNNFHYKGSVKLDISNVKLTRTVTRKEDVTSADFDIGPCQTVLPEGTAPSAHLLSQRLPNTTVGGWTKRKMWGEEYNVSRYRPNPGAYARIRLSEIAFSDALSKEIMSKEGKQGVHTVQGTMYGLSHICWSPDFKDRRNKMEKCVADEKARRLEEREQQLQAELESRGDLYDHVEAPSETTNHSRGETTEVEQQNLTDEEQGMKAEEQSLKLEEQRNNIENQSTNVEKQSADVEQQGTNVEERSTQKRQSYIGDDLQSWEQLPLWYSSVMSAT